DGAGDRVCVDVVGLASRADTNRRDDRDDIGLLEGIEHSGGNLLRLTDKAEIDLGSDPALDPGASHLPCLDQSAILAAEPDRAAALGIDRRDELLVDRPGENHLDDLHRLAVGNPQPVDEAALDPAPLQHLADLRPDSVDDDRIDAGLLQQHDVARAPIAGCRIAHRVAAVLEARRAPGISAHIRQRLCQDRRLGHGIGVRDRGRQREVRACAHRGAYSIAVAPAPPRSAESAKLPSDARKAAMPRRSNALVRWISGCAAGWVASSAAVRSATSASSPDPTLSVLVRTIW